MPDAKLPAVPETILKRRKRQAENRANRAKLAVKAKVDRRKKRVEIFKRAEKYAKEYQDKERDEIRSVWLRYLDKRYSDIPRSRLGLNLMLDL